MSELQTLSALTAEEKKDALASATKVLLPRPDEQPQAFALPQQIFDEIRAKLRIKPTNDSPEARAKILSYISAALSTLLKAADTTKVKERLGQRGDLSPRQYKIRYPSDFFNFQRALAVRRSHVEQALTSPSQVQHLSAKNVVAELPQAIPNVSFYSRVHVDRKGAPFSLVVLAIRKNDVQHVYSAWRIYHDEINMPDIYTPLSVFEAFVRKYGEELRIAGKPMGKFLLFKVLPHITQKDLDEIPTPAGRRWTLQLNWRVNPEIDTAYITFGYLINIDHYCADLSARNVPVHPEAVMTGNFYKYVTSASDY
jgi:hypothetical protein